MKRADFLEAKNATSARLRAELGKGRGMVSLALDRIKTDGGTQSRAEVNPAVVEDYAQTIRDGADFPPVTVFHDGKHYWLADGFHRVAAYRAAGALEIAADIRQGDKREAILFSVGANAAHGLRRTNDDKRRAVMVLLNDAEWSKWSDREIARRCGVSHNFVSSLRPSLSSDDSEPRTYTTKHGTVAKMETAKIGSHGGPSEEGAFDLYAVAGQSRQAENDAFRERRRKDLPPSIQKIEEAKARNGSHHAAVTGRVPLPRPEPEEHPDAIKAHRDELLEEVVALRADVADRDRRLAKYDAMVAQYEKGGFEAIIATKDERIEGLKRQVEDMSADRASLAKSRDFWRKTAIDLGYVSPNSQIEVEEVATKADDTLAEEAGF